MFKMWKKVGCLILAGLIQWGCSANESNVKPQIMSISALTQFQVASFAKSFWAPISGMERVIALRSNDVDSLVVESFKIVLSDIAVSKGTELTGNGSEAIYECEGDTDDECLIDLADGSAVDGLLEDGGGPVSPGDLTFAMIGTCKDGTSEDRSEQGSFMRIKAKFTKDSQTYYTTSNTGVTEHYLSTDASSYGEAKIWVSGCRTYNVFQNKITIKEGESPTIKMFYDLRNSLYVSDQTDSAAGCTKPKDAEAVTLGANQFQLCGGYPYLAGMITSKTPDLQRYVVTESSSTARLFGFYFESGTTEVVGGFGYNYYNSTYTETPVGSLTFKEVSNTTSSTLTIKTYGGSSSTDEIDDEPGDLNTTEFPLLDTLGASQTFTVSNGDGVESTLTAIRLE